MTMQQPSNEELQNEQHSVEEQVEQLSTVEQESKINEEDYKNLQSTYTKANQERIDLAKKLVGKDKSEILDIKDKKLQGKIIKDLYGYDSLEELQAIHGNKFFDNNKNFNEEDDDLDSLKQKMKLMEYRSEKAQVDGAIRDYVSKNGITDEDVISSLREELKFISTDLEIKERISRAGKIVNTGPSGYLAMTDKVVKTNTKVEEKTAVNPVADELSSIFKKYL